MREDDDERGMRERERRRSTDDVEGGEGEGRIIPGREERGRRHGAGCRTTVPDGRCSARRAEDERCVRSARGNAHEGHGRGRGKKEDRGVMSRGERERAELDPVQRAVGVRTAG